MWRVEYSCISIQYKMYLFIDKPIAHAIAVCNLLPGGAGGRAGARVVMRSWIVFYGGHVSIFRGSVVMSLITQGLLGGTIVSLGRPY